MAKTPTRGERRGRVARRSPLVNRAVRVALDSPLLHHLLDASVCELRIRGRRTGRTVVFPVQYAREGGDVVVLAGAAAGKTWWRNFLRPYPVEVRFDRTWHGGVGRTVPAGHPGRPAALRTYRSRFPRVRPRDADPFVVITLLPGEVPPR